MMPVTYGTAPLHSSFLHSAWYRHGAEVMSYIKFQLTAACLTALLLTVVILSTTNG
jgi:hypothetical protein